MVSDSSSGAGTVLNGATLTLENIYTAGGILNNGSAIYNSSPNIITYGSVVPDPFANAVPNALFLLIIVFTEKRRFNSGVYCGGITLNGSQR